MSPYRLAVSRFSGVVACLVLVGGLLSAAGPAIAATTAGSGSAAGEVAVGWRQVTAGYSHTCGIRTNGRLYCWGRDEEAQLGDGGTNTDQPVPVQVAGNHTDWTNVTAGYSHTCARRTNGRLYCWGHDGLGQLGDGGTNTDQPVPVRVAGNRTDWANVSAGYSHTCARRSTGRLYCWGDDGLGQVGDGGTNTNQPTPVQVAGNRTDWATVTGGEQHTCARRTTGRLFCWGYDAYGQLGNGGTYTDRPTPVQVFGSRTDWVTVTAGALHTCARRNTGRLYCWGLGGNGQVGDGSNTQDHPTPVQVVGNRTDWTSLTAGARHTCARRRTGRLYCWGQDFHGQLGNGSATTDDQYTPVQVAGNRTDWARVAAGHDHTCGIRTGGRLYCWGYDAYGQVGDGGTNTDQPSPVEVVL